MVRDALSTLALTGEVIIALRQARRLVVRRPHAIKPMMTSQPNAVRPNDEVVVRRVARVVGHASRVVSGSTCLVRAVAAYLVLARRGVYATVCLGHDSDGEAPFFAHAWLEIAGRAVVGEPSAVRFHSPSP